VKDVKHSSEGCQFSEEQGGFERSCWHLARVRKGNPGTGVEGNKFDQRGERVLKLVGALKCQKRVYRNGKLEKKKSNSLKHRRAFEKGSFLKKARRGSSSGNNRGRAE